MAAPVDPFPNFVPAALADGDQVDARFTALFTALDRSKVSGGLDAASIKDAMITLPLLVADPWQSIVLGNPTWAPNTLEFYKDPMSIVRIKAKGYTVTGSEPGASAVMGTLPAGYRPGVTEYLRYMVNTGAGNLGTCYFSIDTAGVIRCGAGGLSLSVGSHVTILGGVFRAEN